MNCGGKKKKKKKDKEMLNCQTATKNRKKNFRTPNDNNT